MAGTALAASGEDEFFAADEDDDGVEGGGPVLFGVYGVVSQSLDIEAYREAFLRAGQVDHCRTDDAVEHGEGMMERLGVASEAAQELLLKVKRGEERTFAAEEIDVAAEARRGFIGFDAEIDAQSVEFVSIHQPCIGFRGKDGRSRCVQGTEGVHQGWIVLGFREMVEVVGVLAQVNKSTAGV